MWKENVSLNGFSNNHWCELWHKKTRVQVSGIQFTFSNQALPLSCLHKSVGQPSPQVLRPKLPAPSLITLPHLSLPESSIHNPTDSKSKAYLQSLVLLSSFLLLSSTILAHFSQSIAVTSKLLFILHPSYCTICSSVMQSDF